MCVLSAVVCLVFLLVSLIDHALWLWFFQDIFFVTVFSSLQFNMYEPIMARNVAALLTY